MSQPPSPAHPSFHPSWPPHALALAPHSYPLPTSISLPRYYADQVNIALLLANKWLISLTGFNATNTLTLFHMLTSAAASYALVHAGFYPAKPLTRALLWRITVLAASFTVSVAACMASLAYLPASFVQVRGEGGSIVFGLKGAGELAEQKVRGEGDRRAAK